MSKQQLAHGFASGNWERTYQAIADARNAQQEAAKKKCSGCLVEHFEFAIHLFNSKGQVAAKPALIFNITRTKGSIQRAAKEYSKANPGVQFAIVYRGWYDGSHCLPRYNNPLKPKDRIERIVKFQLPVFFHSGVDDGTGLSHEEQAAQAVMQALSSQV